MCIISAPPRSRPSTLTAKSRRVVSDPARSLSAIVVFLSQTFCAWWSWSENTTLSVKSICPYSIKRTCPSFTRAPAAGGNPQRTRTPHLLPPPEYDMRISKVEYLCQEIRSCASSVHSLRQCTARALPLTGSAARRVLCWWWCDNRTWNETKNCVAHAL